MLGLRKKIGAAHGVPQVSREVLANLIGAAVGSIVNWERGMAPRPLYLEKLRNIERQLAAGELRVTVPRRGRQPAAGAAAPVRRGPGRPRGSTNKLAHEPTNAAPVLYANNVRVEEGTHDARIRFALVMPGNRDVRAIADVIVPRDVLGGLR